MGLFRRILPFIIIIEFDKMQIPLGNGEGTHSRFSLATIGVCVFVRLLR